MYFLISQFTNVVLRGDGGVSMVVRISPANSTLVRQENNFFAVSSLLAALQDLQLQKLILHLTEINI